MSDATNSYDTRGGDGMSRETTEDQDNVIVSALRHRRDRLRIELKRVESALEKFNGFTELPLIYNAVSLIVDILKQHGGWVSPAEIRTRYAKITSQSIAKSTLRYYLVKYEDEMFLRRGHRRGTEWSFKSDTLTPEKGE